MKTEEGHFVVNYLKMDRKYVRLSLILIPMIVYLSIMFRVIDNFCENAEVSTEINADTTDIFPNLRQDGNISRYIQSLVKQYDDLEQQRNYLLAVLRNVLNRNVLGGDKNTLVTEMENYIKTQSGREHPKNRMSPAEDVVKPRYIFNCTNIHKITLKEKIGHGVSKQAFLGYHKGYTVAVKMVTRHQKDVKNCIQKIQGDDMIKRQNCFAFPNMKLMKEILLLEQMDHSGFIKLLGYCVRSEESDSTDLSEHGVTAVYEYGKRLNVENLQFNTFGIRLRHAINLADFLSYLENSPLGSLRVRDFKESHFLMVNNSIKMIDLDDVDNLEPSCDIYYDTANIKEPDIQTTACEYDLPCYMGLCIGSNAKNNLKMMNRIFFSRLLHPKLFPSIISEKLSDLIARIETYNISASQLVNELTALMKIVFSKYGHSQN